MKMLPQNKIRTYMYSQNDNAEHGRIDDVVFWIFEIDLYVLRP